MDPKANKSMVRKVDLLRRCVAVLDRERDMLFFSVKLDEVYQFARTLHHDLVAGPPLPAGHAQFVGHAAQTIDRVEKLLVKIAMAR